MRLNEIYKLAKTRKKKTKDLTNVRHFKRWKRYKKDQKKYYRILLNEDCLGENQEKVEGNKRFVDKINKIEVLCVINKMIYKKAVVSEGLPVNI